MSASLTGQLLALLSAACFALANNCIANTQRSGGDKGVMFSVVVTIVISLGLWLVAEGGVSETRLSMTGVICFILAGVSAMFLGRSLLFESVRRLGVARSTAVKAIDPFFSVILAAMLLGERFDMAGILGLVLIAASFGLLIHESLSRLSGKGPAGPGLVSYSFGVGAAVASSIAYILRKIGLDAMRSPALGTLISAVAGFATFFVLALFIDSYRRNFIHMFDALDRWVVLAAVLVSGGQISLFAALAYEKVSVVVMIASLEIFISIFLSVVVFRSERNPGVPVLAAAVLAGGGVVLLAL